MREALLQQQSALVAALRSFAASIPRALLAATSAQFMELEHALRAKPTNIEEVKRGECNGRKRWQC